MSRHMWGSRAGCSLAGPNVFAAGTGTSKVNKQSTKSWSRIDPESSSRGWPLWFVALFLVLHCLTLGTLCVLLVNARKLLAKASSGFQAGS